jgi:hypothetical protein
LIGVCRPEDEVHLKAHLADDYLGSFSWKTTGVLEVDAEEKVRFSRAYYWIHTSVFKIVGGPGRHRHDEIGQ